TTSETGGYTIIGLPYGDYNIFAGGGANPQYVSEWYNNQSTRETADTVSVTAEAADVTGIDFVLAIGGSITGVVTPNGGDSWLNDVRVLVFNATTKGKVAEAGTLQDGMTYLVQGIPAGSYIVMAKAQERARVYWNNTIDINAATSVQVTAPGVTANINFSLPEGGRFNGRVMMPGSPEPVQLSGAKVTAYMLNDLTTSDEEFDDLIFSIYTNDMGEYELDGLPFGDYKIKAQGGEGQTVIPRYWSEYGGASTWEEAGVKHLDNRWGEWIEFWLDPAALATGSVFQGDGVTPIEGANVFAMEEMFYGEGSDWQHLSATQTEADGSFELFVPADRNFVVGAEAEGRVRMFFQGTFDPSEAVRFHLMVGEEVGGVNFSLEPAGTISGTIYDAATGQPLADCMAMATNPTTGVNFKASTDASGTYTIDNLPFGEYIVMAMGMPDDPDTQNYAMEWWQETNNWDAATPVVVNTATSDVTGINFTLEPGGAIEGMVRHEHGWDMDGALVTLYLLDGTPIARTRSRGWEGYRFNGVPSGSYKISAWYIEPQGNSNTQHVFYNGQGSFETADVIEVTAPNTVSGIDFSLPQANGQISGLIIYSGELQPSDYQQVVVVARPYDFYASDEMSYTKILADVGSYMLERIADGTYIVMAFLDVDGNSRPDAGEPYGFYGDPNTVTLQSTPENQWPQVPGVTIIITDEAKGIIVGEAFLEDSEDNSGITVSAGSYQTTTDADGSYILNVAPGTYTVTISKGNYLAAVSAEVYVVDVLSGEPTEMPAAVLLKGDYNGDGIINIADLIAVAENLGTTGPAGDLNSDGSVDALDLVPIGRNFGETSSLWLEEGSTPSVLPQGNGLASVTIDPAAETFAPGETTGIDVNVKDALNIFAAEFHLSFDPALVEVQDADASLGGAQIAPSDELFPFVPGAYHSDAGTALYYYSYSASGGGYFIASCEADNTLGTIDYTIVLLAPENKDNTNPVSAGSSGADLATITFLGVDEGNADIAFSGTPKLADGLGDLITVDTLTGATLTVQTPPPEISDIVISNVGDKSFTVSWVTNVDTTGQINYGTSVDSLTSAAYDDRGETTEDDTHHVTISGLAAGTTYYFEVVSGVTTDDNGGSKYNVTTGPSLSFTMPEMISGKVYKMDGTTPAEGTIVYAQIGTSQVLSGLVDSSGTWGLNIAPIRTADFQNYYTHADADEMTIDAQGGGDGSGSQTVTIADAKAGTPEITLIPNYAPTVENVTASQDAGTGTISIEYDVYDQDEDDTSVEVSFAYWNGSAYATCTTVTGSGTKTVSTTATHYTATWDAKTDFNGKYMTTAKIKVLANDGNVQGIGNGISADFTLDTKGPIDVACSSPATGATDVSVSPTLTAGTASDQSAPISYKFVVARDAAFETGVQESSWLDTNTWVPSPRLQAPEVTYYWKVKAKDSFGNISESTAFTLTTLAVIPVDATLVDGWNIIGLAVEPSETYTASTMAAEINEQGGNVTQVFYWNAAAGSWDFYLVEIQYGTDFELEVGNGYLLQSTTASTWTYWGVPMSADYSATVDPQVTNVADKSFTVSWISQSAEQGLVNYGTSPDSLTNVAYDDRGQSTSDDTHHVSISGLTAETTYYYEVVSGGTTYNNGGSPYQITTGPSLSFTMPEMINGTTNKTGGTTAAEGAIVYAQIGTSQVLSSLVDSSGTWGLNIAPIRTADFQSYYTHADTDEISVEAQGAGDGSDSQTVTISTAKSGAPAMEVSIAAQLDFVDGWNLVALPVEPATSYTASTAAAQINDQGGNITQVFWWNAAAGGWDFYLVEIQYGTDFDIELGEGYLFQSSTASTWSIPGS
ncbi:MAG TPA: hypothetical protein G4O18_00065, partial [Dehalococcoidia bacterium]|nr:hypothetical protein [Dehalococcoidia bacterium]